MTPTSLGPYAIRETLGKGGMGSVYRAEHVDTGEIVAVKALAPQLAASEGFRERFEAEIDSLQTLKHAGIVRLFGYGEQDGGLFYAMELVDGPSLEDEIRRGRRFDWRETAQIGVQVSRALKHAHDHGVVHRDIKPANILLDGRGRAKLADFGIARLFGSTGVTVAGGVLGTADYMSPEQAAGQPVTARCDQYSLGGVMYALLAGRPPFRARDFTAMLQMQRYAVADSVRRHAPDTPEELDRTIRQLLAKEPQDRFPNTLVLARHLEAMLRALSRPKADDFELYDASKTDYVGLPDEDAPLAVTRDATRPPTAPQPPPPAEATTPSVSQIRSLTGRRVDDDDTGDFETASASRYTSVNETTTAQPGFWRSLVGQAMVLLVAFGTLGGVAWWLTLPRSANQLYRAIESRHARGETDRLIRDAIDEFLERHADDPRAVEVAAWAQDVERERMKRQVSVSRLGALATGKEASAEELLYRRASEIADGDAASGASAFQTLAMLLAAGDDGTDPKRQAFADLAENEASRLRAVDRAEQEQLADFARDRLKVAQRLLPTDRTAAVRIARGVLTLVERSDATAPVLNDARALLAAARRSE